MAENKNLINVLVTSKTGLLEFQSVNLRHHNSGYLGYKSSNMLRSLLITEPGAEAYNKSITASVYTTLSCEEMSIRSVAELKQIIYWPQITTF